MYPTVHRGGSGLHKRSRNVPCYFLPQFYYELHNWSIWLYNYKTALSNKWDTLQVGKYWYTK